MCAKNIMLVRFFNMVLLDLVRSSLASRAEQPCIYPRIGAINGKRR